MLDGVLDVPVHVAHAFVVVRVELPAFEAELDVRVSDDGLNDVVAVHNDAEVVVEADDPELRALVLAQILEQ